MTPTTGPVVLHLPDGNVTDADLTLTPVYQPWGDHLTHDASLKIRSVNFRLNGPLTQLSGPRRDVARTLGIVTAGTTPELSIPIQLEGEQGLLLTHRQAAAEWLHDCRTRDLRHHRPVLITHSGGGYALGHGRRLAQGEQQAVRQGSFTPPGAVLAHFLPRVRLQQNPHLDLHLDLEDPGENDTTESGDRLRFIRPERYPDPPHP